MKVQCADAAKHLITELDVRFPQVDLMMGLGVVFAQYWVRPDLEENFTTHIFVIKKHFATTKRISVGADKREVKEPINGQAPAQQQSFFKLTMMQNAEKVMAKPCDVNPMTKQWKKLNTNPLLCNRISEWFKLAELAIVTVIRSMEDERMFSTLSWMENKIKNRLGKHLDFAVFLYAQPFWTRESFPYSAAYDEWKSSGHRRGQLYRFCSL